VGCGPPRSTDDRVGLSAARSGLRPRDNGTVPGVVARSEVLLGARSSASSAARSSSGVSRELRRERGRRRWHLGETDQRRQHTAMQARTMAQGESACKPASVSREEVPGWRPSIWDRRCRRPRAVHQGTRPGQPPRPRRRGRCVPYSTLLRVGFTEPTGHPAAGALLPHRFTLAALLAGRRSTLCGTVLRVAPTGGWPAPCPVEAGLSSIPANRDRGRPAGSPCPASMPPEAGPAGATGPAPRKECNYP
jgi:hypothetical protein